jgi:hypothetical protein
MTLGRIGRWSLLLGALLASTFAGSSAVTDVDEDFEGPLSYTWYTTEQAPWMLTGERAHSPTHSVVSATDAGSAMWVEMVVREGTLSFHYYKDSGERLEVCYGYEEGGMEHAHCHYVYASNAWHQVNLEIKPAYADREGFFRWRVDQDGTRIFIDDVTFPGDPGGTVYLPLALNRPKPEDEPTPPPQDRGLRAISCHLFFWWRPTDLIGEYRETFLCAPKHDTKSAQIRGITYNGVGLITGFHEAITLGDTGATYTVDLSGGRYNRLGQTTTYDAAVSGSYFDGFDQEVTYAYTENDRWDEATVTKAYEGGETYTVEVTPCWDWVWLAGYTTQVYGGPYDGQGVTVGDCP